MISFNRKAITYLLLPLLSMHLAFAKDEMNLAGGGVLDKPTISGKYQISEYDRICGATLSSELVNSQGQKAGFCVSARDAIISRKAERALWITWSAVASICLYSCANTLYAGAVQNIGLGVCTAAQAGGAITQGIISQSASQAMLGVIGPAVSALVVGRKATTATEGAAKASKLGKLDKFFACLPFLTAAGQAIAHGISERNNEETAMANLEKADKFESEKLNYSGNDPQVASTETTGKSGTGVANSIQGKSEEQQSTSDSLTPPPTACRSTANSIQTAQCAVALDSSLPPAVGAPQFANDFQQMTGKNPNSLIQSSSPAQAILGSTSGDLPEKETMALKSVLDSIENHVDQFFSGSAYASGGGGRAPSGDSSDAQLNAMMNQALSMMKPPGGKESPEEQQMIREENFEKSEARSVAVEIPQDRDLSIFERISFRYGVLQQ